MHKPRNALYLLPNAFTTLALFCGFYAILQAITGNWQLASLLVVAAAFLDSCDGRVARLTGTTSTFGVEYDSLSDVVAFGVAPAILLFQWSLVELGKFGFATAFCYCAATALRLARFNAQVGSGDRKFFIGLPSPAAALLLVSFAFCAEYYRVSVSAYVVSFICLLMAATMISGIRFYSFKTINIRARRPLYNGLLLIYLIALFYVFANDLILLLFAVLVIYIAVSYGFAVLSFVWKRKRRS